MHRASDLDPYRANNAVTVLLKLLCGWIAREHVEDSALRVTSRLGDRIPRVTIVFSRGFQLGGRDRQKNDRTLSTQADASEC